MSADKDITTTGKKGTYERKVKLTAAPIPLTIGGLGDTALIIKVHSHPPWERMSGTPNPKKYTN